MTAYLVAGLAFGDEGKGSITDALIRRTGANLIIRYNGGSQAAHNVITPDNTHHTFAQFGSGMFVPGVRTYLSRFMLVDLSTMLVEAEDLATKGLHSATRRVYIDHRAFVITYYHKILNKLRELARESNRHGSTGMGIGVTREMSLIWPYKVPTVGDCLDKDITKDKLDFVRDRVSEEAFKLFPDSNRNKKVEEQLRYLELKSFDWIWDRYQKILSQVNVVIEPPLVNTGIVFEGAQGMLLDEKFGFQPHTTWTDITFNNAITILKEMGYSSPIHRIGVVRSYYTRHGDGPFPSEDSFLRQLEFMAEKHNKFEEYTGDFRIGNFDIPLLMKALRDIGGVDYLAINHMDIAAKLSSIPVRLSKKHETLVPYHHFIDMVAEISNTPVNIIGHGPSAIHKDFKESVCSSSL
jgi:adenylosuccinate synthase